MILPSMNCKLHCIYCGMFLIDGKTVNTLVVFFKLWTIGRIGPTSAGYIRHCEHVSTTERHFWQLSH